MTLKKKLSRKVISYALALMMVFNTFTGIVPGTGITAQAATDKTIAGLGTSAISNPTSTESTATAWAGSYVYYGKYDGTSPTKYRVLDRASSDFGVAGGSLLLDCNTTLYNAKFHDSNKAWSSSTLRSGLQGGAFRNKSGVFTEQEKGAIASSTKANAAQNDGEGELDMNYVALSGDTVFVLDEKEVTRTSYGYASKGTRKKSGTSSRWWLRSPSTFNENYASYVDPRGTISNINVNPQYSAVGVSPAFNIKLSSVIFASLITGTAGAAGAEYKLTLKDDKLGIARTNGKKVTKSGDTLTIPYTVSGNNSANATQVSVLVTDKAYTDSDATILKYGKLADVTGSTLSGEADFELPSNLTGTLGTDYRVYLLAEDVNGEKETDYANLKEITEDDIEVKPAQTVNPPEKATDLKYTGQAQALLTSGASVTTGNTATGSIKYKVGANGTWSTEIPTETNAGEYKVYYKVEGNNEYGEFVSTDEQAVSVSIAKAAAPATKDSLTPEQKPAAKNADELIYTGKPIELVTAPTGDLPADYKVQYSLDDTNWSQTIPTGTNTGDYTVSVKYVSDNYEDIPLDDIAVKITPVSKEQLKNATKAASDYLATIDKDNDDYSDVVSDLQKAIKAANDALEIANLTADQVAQAVNAINDAKTAAEKAVKAIDDEKAAKAVIEKIKALTPATEITPSDRAAIEAARKAYDDLTDDQKAKLAELYPNAVATLEAAEQALDTAEKAAFDDEKEVQKKAADALEAEGDSDANKKLIEDTKKAINELAYDKSKSVDENKAALAAIVSKLKSDLTDNRAAEKKEADDTAAAKKVIDAINALPASNKVATTDKAAIEAVRKEYDALTADQKKKVPADVLKKLTDAEAALKAATAADKAAKELVAAKKEAQAAMNEQVTVTQKGNKFTVKWKKSTSADGYYVYASYCGKKATKPAKTVKKNTTTKVTISKINGKKISAKKNFHVYVVPYKIIDGKNVILGKSAVAHVVGAKNTKYSNVKKLTLTKKKYTVKVGKTAKIKAKVTLVNKNKKHISKGHGAKFRYKSSDTGIATVDKNGKIKGIKKGKCTIYVYSINGLMKKAKITVK